MKHLGDITKINGAEVPIVDVVCGGSPCQDLSVAWKRAGLAGERSGLFMEQIRIIKEMRNECIRQLSMRGSIEFIRPRFMVWENVPGAFSSNNGEDFRAVLEETVKVADENAVIPEPEGRKWSPAGCIVGDGWSVAWRVHDAQYWGVPQRRKRICLVADFNGDTAGKILFELQRETEQFDSEPTVGYSGEESRSEVQPIAEGLSGDTEQSGTQGEGTAANAKRGIGETGGGKGILIQDEHVCAFEPGASSRLGGHVYGDDVAGTVRANAGDNQQAVVYGISAYESNAMKSSNPNSGIYEAETARTLDLNGGSPACNQGGMAVVCIEGNGSRESHRGKGYVEGETMFTLNTVEQHAVCIENNPADSRVKISEDGKVQTLSSQMGTGGENVPMVMESINGEISGTLDASYYKGCGERQGVEREVVCVGNGQLAQARISDKVGALNCMHDQQAIMTYGLDRAAYNQGMNAQYDFAVDEEKIGTQVAKGPGAVCNDYVVRRLTPLECERLQGFPDYWTNIGDWVDSKGKTHKGDSDSPRYKALGNSIALPFWEWMAKRMRKYLVDDPTMASLFDGIGGFPLSFSRAGVEPVWASEIEEFPIAVTKIRFPD